METICYFMNTILPKPLLIGSEIDERWFKGPFPQLKLLPPKAKGKRFEEIGEYILKSKGFTVEKSKSTDYDRLINGEKYEIKGSTITKGANNKFSFLQIRPNQEYDYLMLESFWFYGKITFHKIPKKNVDEFVKLGVFKKQHGGNKAKSGTYIYNGSLDIFEDFKWFEVQIDA